MKKIVWCYRVPRESEHNALELLMATLWLARYTRERGRTCLVLLLLCIAFSVVWFDDVANTRIGSSIKLYMVEYCQFFVTINIRLFSGWWRLHSSTSMLVCFVCIAFTHDKCVHFLWVAECFRFCSCSWSRHFSIIPIDVTQQGISI